MDLRPRVVNDVSCREVRALSSYFRGTFIPAGHEDVVKELARHRTRVLLAALYEHPGLESPPATARQWVTAVDHLVKSTVVVCEAAVTT
jgi:hypothetical protein